MKICFLFFIALTRFAKSEDVKLWNIVQNSIEVSREAISVPSVRILDKPGVIYFEKSKEIATVSLSTNDVTLLTGKGDLDPAQESFFDTGVLFALELKKNQYTIIFREAKGNRYMISSGKDIKLIIFQQSDSEYFSRERIPKVISVQMDEFTKK